MFFSETEHCRLHNKFGQQHTDKLYSLLKHSLIPNIDLKTREIYGDFTSKCLQCQRYAQAPRRSKSDFWEDKSFNRTVFIDKFYVDKRPTLHFVDESRHHQAARWLRTVLDDDVWHVLCMCWINVFLGPPDVIKHDAGKNLWPRYFSRTVRCCEFKRYPFS